MTNYNEIFRHFNTTGTFGSIRPLGHGHIHDTFLVTTPEEELPGYVLQRINDKIFTDVPRLMENMLRVTSHLALKLSRPPEAASGMVPMKLIPTHDRLAFYQDREGRYWRCFEFCPNIDQGNRLISTQQAFEGGKALGTFQHLLSDLPGKPLFEILPDFHNAKKRFETFTRILHENPAGRVDMAKNEIDKIMARSDEMMIIQQLGDAGKIPVRVTHNDTKFNNILFDQIGHAICIIDLDTVMNGFVLYDFGDAIRTLANTAAEDEANLDLVRFNLDLYQSFTEGYLSAASSFLTPIEATHLAFSAKLLTYIIGMRFLTDFLAGDVYYKTAYPDHNLVRARNQIRLLEKMEEDYGKMKAVITANWDFN